jgi:hypothetical protein
MALQQIVVPVREMRCHYQDNIIKSNTQKLTENIVVDSRHHKSDKKSGPASSDETTHHHPGI